MSSEGCAANVDLSMYGLDAIMKSAYRFTGRCYVQLKQQSAAVVEVNIRPKRVEEDSAAVMAEFLNDLLEQRLRAMVSAETSKTCDLIMAYALSKTTLLRPDLEFGEVPADGAEGAKPDRQKDAAS